jgi:hypothetical protein
MSAWRNDHTIFDAAALAGTGDEDGAGVDGRKLSTSRKGEILLWYL